jgi:DNA polymerase
LEPAVKVRDLVRYQRDLGWTDPPDGVTFATADARIESHTAEQPAACGDLESIAELVARCDRCRLGEKRRTAVPGEGAAHAVLMFVGEGPGAEEDRTGRPFVGQAGQLLEGMILALGLARDEVFITNVVKCRPPGNRTPQAEEMAACAAFLDRQIELIGPRIIVPLGRPAAQRLTGSDRPMGAMRGRWSTYRGVPLLPTYHPAYLLRSPTEKRVVWKDLKLVRAKLRELGIG